MKPQRTLPRSLIALAAAATLAAAGCSSVPDNNATLEQARSDYRAAQANPVARDLAQLEMKQAGDALARAEAASQRKDAAVDVDHLAYLAKTRVAIAQEAGAQRGAEQAVVAATAERDKTRLLARTAEADAATRSAANAQQDAAASQRQANAAQVAANTSMQQAAASQQQAAVSQQATADAESRNRELQQQITDLNAKPTVRGLVVTLGDVLFDTAQADLKSGAARSVEKLAGFLKQYPQRTALVEGFTDSVGGDEMNQALSSRRADAVRAALVGQGIGGERITSKGYGEAYPVAGNDNASGRQMNRRVEIVLSDDKGQIAPR